MTKAKSCPQGKYWCFDDKKCKKIPLGYHIGHRGYLYPDEKDNGTDNGNGNGNGGNGNGNGTGGNGNGGGVSEMKENFKRINQSGMTYAVMLYFRGRTYNVQFFVPSMRKPNRLEIEKEVQKIYPGAIVRYFEPREFDPTDPTLMVPESMQPGAKDLVQQSNYMKPALQQKKPKKPVKNECGCKEEFTIDKDAHNKAKKKAKLRNLAKNNENPAEKEAAEKKAGGPKLFGEDNVRVEGKFGYVEFIDLIKPEPMKGVSEASLKSLERASVLNASDNTDDQDKAREIRVRHDYASLKKQINARKKHKVGVAEGKKEEKKPEKAMDAGARAKRKLARKEYASKVSGSEDIVPDDLRERKLTKGEEKEKERVVKGMKKDKKGFKERYGKDAESVMYATATKLAKEELAPHISKGVEAAKPLVKNGIEQAMAARNGEKPKPKEKPDSKSVFKQLTNKDEID